MMDRLNSLSFFILSLSLLSMAVPDDLIQERVTTNSSHSTPSFNVEGFIPPFNYVPHKT